MSNFVQRHRQQPTKLPRPWDSPGKNTGVGCHFLLQCRKVKSESEVAQSSLTLSDPMGCSLPGSSIHGIFQARVLEWGAIAFRHPGHLRFLWWPPSHQVFLVLGLLHCQTQMNLAAGFLEKTPRTGWQLKLHCLRTSSALRQTLTDGITDEDPWIWFLPSFSFLWLFLIITLPGNSQ